MAADENERWLIRQWGLLDKSIVSPQGVAFAVAAYDDCIADLDERLGMLVDELGRRGILEKTWTIIISDHGESFGEHAGFFTHGTSLYDTELHVPFLIVPPGGEPPASRQGACEPARPGGDDRRPGRSVARVAVSGASLAGYWNQDPPAVPIQPIAVSPSLAELVPNNRKMRDFWTAPSGSPLGAVKDGEWSYIRRELPIHEALFHIRSDPGEQHNLASDPAAQMTLQRMRAALNELTGGPLVTERFSR